MNYATSLNLVQNLRNVKYKLTITDINVKLEKLFTHILNGI
jgi:hypothetical protein